MTLTAFVAVASILAGCGEGISPGPPGSEAPSALSPHDASPTAVANDPAMDPSLAPTASLLTPPTRTDPPEATEEPLTELERSDRFFEGIGYRGLGVFTGPPPGYRLYESLSEMTLSRDVDLVVRGRILNVHFVRYCMDDPDLGCFLRPWVLFEIDEVIKGHPASRDFGRIQLYGRLHEWGPAWRAETDEIMSLVPDHEVLLFLGNEAAEQARTGQDPRGRQRARYTYYPVSFQGILRDVDGQVRTVGPSTTMFPRELEGQPFAEVVQQVREIAGPVQAPQRTTREVSDVFFRAIGFGRYEPHFGSRWYDSLREISGARLVDLIVRGTFTGVRLEPYCFEDPDFGCFTRPVMTFAVEAVLKGSESWSSDRRIEVFGRRVARDVDPAELPSLVPDHDVLLFLGTVRSRQEASGQGPDDPGAEASYYPVNFQGIIRELGDRVRTIDPGASYPTQLEGQPFDDVLERIRRLVAEAE